MKKVLFITYFFPPLGGAGVWRSLKFSKYLPEYGWQPVVISADKNADYEKDHSLTKEIPECVKVHRVRCKEVSKEWSYIAKKLKLDFTYPYPFKSWYTPAFKKAREILKGEKIDLVFSSSAPYISHIIAKELKKEFNIPWIADFRDPWTNHDGINIYNDRFLISPLRKINSLRTKIAEKEIIDHANKTIVVSWRHKENLCRTHGIKEDVIEVITNGYDETDFDKDKKVVLYSDRTIITFVGSFYFDFKKIAVKFLNVLDKVSKNTEVVFVGGSALEMKDVEKENLTCICTIAKKKLIPLCLGSDFLLLITLPSAKWHIPGKTFEYLRLNKPIIALVPEDGDAAKIIKSSDSGFIVSYRENKMVKQLEGIFEKKGKGVFNSFDNNLSVIKQFERRKLTRKLADVFDNETTV